MREAEMNDLDAIAKLMELQPPKGIGVIPQTTPVISFGDFTKARIATVGINPSSKEFLSGRNLRKGAKKRLIDFESLGAGAGIPLTEESATKVWDGCASYFKNKNRYWTWFKHLEDVLKGSGFSYEDGTACHLDLSPWATDPVWSKLTAAQKRELIADGQGLLNWQTTNNDVEAIIFNGRQAYEAIKKYTEVQLSTSETIRYKSGGKELTSELIRGKGPLGQEVLGWTLNLQNLRATAVEKVRVKEVLSEWIRVQLGVDNSK